MERFTAHINNIFPPAPICRHSPLCDRTCYPREQGGYHDFCGRSCAGGACGHLEALRNMQNANVPPAGSPAPVHAPAHAPRARILFYNRGEPFYELTNFWEDAQTILIDGKQWRTTEHYYQASKFKSEKLIERVRMLATPREAFEFGRKHANELRADWRHVNLAIMLKALRCKFYQNATLAALLKSTADAELVEHTANDAFFGDAGDGTGENHLGKLLMKVRDELV
jgi:ribA/ribD-fused uncharacterized protein